METDAYAFNNFPAPMTSAPRPSTCQTPLRMPICEICSSRGQYETWPPLNRNLHLVKTNPNWPYQGIEAQLGGSVSSLCYSFHAHASLRYFYKAPKFCTTIRFFLHAYGIPPPPPHRDHTFYNSRSADVNQVVAKTASCSMCFKYVRQSGKSHWMSLWIKSVK